MSYLIPAIYILAAVFVVFAFPRVLTVGIAIVFMAKAYRSAALSRAARSGDHSAESFKQVLRVAGFGFALAALILAGSTAVGEGWIGLGLSAALLPIAALQFFYIQRANDTDQRNFPKGWFP